MIKFLPIILIFFISSCSVEEIVAQREPYIATVNGQYMSLSIYMLYLEEQRNIFEMYAGADIWETVINGIPTLSLAKEHALENMAISMLIRDISTEHDIEISNLLLTDEEFFQESIRIREQLMQILTEPYAQDQREAIFVSMEDTWLLNAQIIRNIEVWDEVSIGD